MKVKEKRRLQIIEYIGDPTNEPPTRSQLAKAIGYKSLQGLYAAFTAAELSEIDKEALELRRTKYAADLAKIDDAVLRQAKAGDHQCAKLAYQRFEQWSERKIHEIDVSENLMSAVTKVLVKDERSG
jgi:hypothetical protein